MDDSTRILMLLSFASVAGVVHLVAQPRPGRLFLVRLTEAERHAAASRRVLRLNLLATAIAAALLLFVPQPTAPMPAALLALLLVLPMSWLAVELALAVRARPPQPPGARFMVSLEAPQQGPTTQTATVASLNAVVLLLPALAMLVANGGDFGPWRFFVPMLVLLNAVVAFARWLQIRERNALPTTNAERFAALLAERRRRIVQLLETARLAWNVTGALVWACVAFGTTGPSGSIAIVAIAVGGPGVVLLFARHLPRLTRLADELAALAGSDALGTRAEGWRLGGLVYYAPEDPALAVPRRSGLGQTLNLARPAAWAVIATVVLSPPLIFALALA